MVLLPPDNGLVDHLERHLGLMAGGWSAEQLDVGHHIQIARFESAPSSGATTLCTLGMSGHELRTPSGRVLRLEVLFAWYVRDEIQNVPALLSQLAAEILDRHEPYLRGEVVGPRGQMFKDTHMTAIYFASPVIFPDGLASWDGVGFSWAVPITTTEAAFIRTVGWDRFEELAEERDVDFLDLTRPAVVAGPSA